MPRSCTICAHPELEAINAGLVAGEPLRNIAQRYETSATALHRHKESHLPAALAKAHEAREIANADDLLGEVRGLHNRTLAILEAAEGSGQLGTALGAIREARGNLELLAKLLDILKDAPAVNITVSAEWVEIRAVLMDALAPYPEARSAAAASLMGLEGGEGR